MTREKRVGEWEAGAFRRAGWAMIRIWRLRAYVFTLMCLAAMAARPARAADWYVAATGNGSVGTSWASAFTNVHEAFTAAGTGDTIRLAGHTFALTGQVTWAQSHITVMGGYAATNDAETPGPRDSEAWPTILTRTGGTMRLIHMRNLTNAVLDGVVLSNGYMTVAAGNTSYDGAGLRAENAAGVTVRSCRILNNTLYNTVDNYQGRGAGIYVQTCPDFALLDSEVSGNYSYNTTWHGRGYAGGMFVGASGGVISNCVFSGNRARATGGNYGYTWSRAGGLYVSGGTEWRIEQTVFAGNRAEHANPAYYTRGGALYLDASPTVRMRNCLLTANDARYEGDGIYMEGGVLSMDFCTLAANKGYGVYRVGGTVSASNSIFWANGDDLFGVSLSALAYCRVEPLDDDGERGNVTHSPVFADTNHWHLASQGGHYAGGYFGGGYWTNTESGACPLIDAADPEAPFSRETNPHGHRANLGAYGNTATASRSFLEEPGVFTNLTVHQYAPVNVGVDQATFLGEVVHTGGGESPRMALCWGVADAGTAATGAWDYVEDLGVRDQWEQAACTISNVAGTIHTRFYVTNSVGEDWSGVRSAAMKVTPTVTNLGAAKVRRRTAELRAAVTDTGGETPRAWFHYWPQAGGPTGEVYRGFQGGAFDTTVSNLAADTPYVYVAAVSNVAGLVLSAESVFTTLTGDPIEWYAATNGDGTVGTNWTTAFTNLQTGLNNVESGDTVFLAGHRFDRTNAELWTVSGVTVLGGYAATNAADRPGPRDPGVWPTILTRTGGVVRLLHIRNLTNAVLDGVVLSNGYMVVAAGNSSYDGAGLRVENATAVTVRNCRIMNNTLYNAVDHFQGQGAGLFVQNSPGFSLLDSEVRGNYSYNTSHHGRGFGGGMFATGGGGVISNCLFIYNRAWAQGGNYDYTYSRAGGLYIDGGTQWDIERTVFVSNRADHASTSAYQTRGGALYVRGTPVVRLRNCLLARNMAIRQGDGIYVENGTVALDFCTVTTNLGYGVFRTNGTVSVTNSIVWANGVELAGITNRVGYSCIGGGAFDGVAGSVSVDPLFDDAVYFHLASRAGVYRDGYFSGGAWARSIQQSPLMDAADPESPYAAEPHPNGRRANMGAYGNTEVASRSLMPGVVVIIR